MDSVLRETPGRPHPDDIDTSKKTVVPCLLPFDRVRCHGPHFQVRVGRQVVIQSITKEISRVRRRWKQADPAKPFQELLTAPRYKPMTVEVLGQPFKIADALSFYWSYQEIFGNEIYQFDDPSQAPRIVDCGANYGLSVVYFKHKFPNARICAIEADPQIFKLLSHNVTSRHLSDVELIHAAVTPTGGPVQFHCEGADSGRVHPLSESKQSITIDGVAFSTLLDEPVDFLKMDIEGAEAECLCQTDSLRNVNQLFVEYHSFEDEPQMLDELLRKLRESGFRYYVQTQFCPKQPLVESENYLGMDLQLNLFACRLPH